MEVFRNDSLVARTFLTRILSEEKQIKRQCILLSVTIPLMEVGKPSIVSPVDKSVKGARAS